jgi:MFS family permease
VWVAVLAKAVSFFGDMVATTALVLRLQAGGAGAPSVAALLVAGLVPIVLLAGPAGRLADRFGSRRLLAWSGGAQAVVAGGLVLVDGRAAVLCLVALLGAGQAVNGATWSALLPSLVPAEELPRALGWSQAANTVGMIAAPAAGGLLTGAVGASAAIALDAATFVLVAVAGVVLPNRTVAPASGRLAGAVSIVRRDALMTSTLLLLAAFVLLGSMVNVVDVFLVRGTLHAGPTAYGLSGATYAVGMLAGAVLAGRRLSGPAQLARAYLLAAGALGVGLAAIGLSPTIAVLLVFGAGAGCANGVLNVASSSLLMGRAAADERGRVGALVSGVASGAQLAAYLAGGALGPVLGPRALFVAAGVLGALTPLLLGRRVLRHAGDQRATTAPRPVRGDAATRHAARTPAPAPRTDAVA